MQITLPLSRCFTDRQRGKDKAPAEEVTVSNHQVGCSTASPLPACPSWHTMHSQERAEPLSPPLEKGSVIALYLAAITVRNIQSLSVVLIFKKNK